jgi:uncharacterized protein (DUF433 family)
MKWQDYIEERPEVMLGKPVFKDTRLTVEHILRELAVMTPDETLRQYPTLRPEHIAAGLRFAADLIAAAKPAKVAG